MRKVLFFSFFYLALQYISVCIMHSLSVHTHAHTH